MDSSAAFAPQLNRTFIASVLFIDIVDYSRRTVPDQLAIKEVFNNLLGEALQNVVPSDRIIVDTGDGAGIAFLGDPEDALFAALSLRDAIDAGRAPLGELRFIRMGINLGPLKVVHDINGHVNMIGDGVNDAQRVMSFAEPGQVMVARSYYDIVSRFSSDYNKLFVYEGTRHDKHVREHEVYLFGPTEGAENLTEKMRHRSKARHPDDQTEPLPASRPAEAQSSRGLRPASRVRLIVSMMSVAAVSVAAWSWTSKPAQPESAEVHASSTASVPVAEASPPTVPVQAVKEKTPAPTMAEVKPATASAAAAGAEAQTDEKPGVVKLAVRPWGNLY